MTPAPNTNYAEVLFCNDLTGKGHVTRVITDLNLAFVKY